MKTGFHGYTLYRHATRLISAIRFASINLMPKSLDTDDVSKALSGLKQRPFGCIPIPQDHLGIGAAKFSYLTLRQGIENE